MYHQLNSVSSSLHITGTTKLEITNRHFPAGHKVDVYTIHLTDHKPGTFTIEIDIDKGYLYLTNLGPSSVDFRLNKESRLGHVQKNRKVALIPNDHLTLFIPYIDHNGNLQSSKLKISLLNDLSLLFDLL